LKIPLMAMVYRRPSQINKITTAMPHVMFHRVPCSQNLAAAVPTKQDLPEYRTNAPIGRV
jgi:hypothetical protein